MMGQDEFMDRIEYESSGIPHGHGLSFKKGLADGLLERESPDTDELPEGHSRSYNRGVSVGDELRKQIARVVRE